MNERIKEIISASGLQYDHLWLHDQFAVDKFAEMLVQECINTVLDCSMEYCTRTQISEELKEHFGVKQ